MYYILISGCNSGCLFLGTYGGLLITKSNNLEFKSVTLPLFQLLETSIFASGFKVAFIIVTCFVKPSLFRFIVVKSQAFGFASIAMQFS